MENYKEKLEQQLLELKEIQKHVTRSLKKKERLPDLHIRVTRCNKSFQYYFVDRKNKTQKYASVKELKRVADLVQKDYETKIGAELDRQCNRLENFLKLYNISCIDDIYNKYPEGKKRLIIPVIKKDEQYIQEWRQSHPGNQNPYPDEAKYYTSQGDYVRSKSEKIIADLLDKYGIPYSYEPRLELNNRHVIYPDFVILNVRKRKTIYWEHLGMLGVVDYARKNFEKIAIYEENGYNVGDNLLISMESEQKPFDAKGIENKIKKYCI